LQPARSAPSALHTLQAVPATVHWGYFDASLAPVLTVKSGDLIQAALQEGRHAQQLRAAVLCISAVPHAIKNR
jgi:hypothetical protein